MGLLSADRRLPVLLAAALMAGAAAAAGGQGITPTNTALSAPRTLLTRDEERALAVEALSAAWDDVQSAEVEVQDPEESILELMAGADLARAERLCVALPAGRREQGGNAITRGLLRFDPPAGLARVAASTADCGTLLAAARCRGAGDLAKVQALLDRATEAAAHLDPQRVPVWLAEVAAVARERGDPRCPERVAATLRVLHEYRDAHKEDARAGEAALIMTAFGLARADLGAAAGLVAQLPPGRRRDRSLLWVARSAAATDPAAAEALLSRVDDDRERSMGLLSLAYQAMRKDPSLAARWVRRGRPPEDAGEDAHLRWQRAAVAVSGALARIDPGAAEVLGRQVDDPIERARALALIGKETLGPRGRELMREAADLAAGTGGGGATGVLLQVAEMASEHPLRRETLMRALEMAARHGYPDSRYDPPQPADVLPFAAYVAARFDPMLARALLEEAVQAQPSPDARSRYGTAVAMAYLRLDPRRAVALARGMPPAGWPSRYSALTAISRYLLLEPERRARIAFGDLVAGFWEETE